MPAHPGEDTLLTIDRRGRDADGRRAGLDSRSTSSSPCCTARTARTARCRACWSSPTSPTSARACSASAVGMDKAMMKVLFEARGLPVAPVRRRLPREWRRDAAVRRERATASGFPCS